ncbi:MAG: transglutaminase family protein [Alphaproteobacteria bacterium]
MSTLTIRHLTTYRYLRPVAFGEHRMMLRPRDSHDQRVIEASLEIRPQPTSLHFIVDDFGNQVGIAQFSDCAQELCVESVVYLEQSPPRVSVRDLEERADRFPFDYSADESAEFALCLERTPADPLSDAGDEVAWWARGFLPPDGSIGTFELLTQLSQAIHCTFRYRRREAKGVQQPVETLRLGHGSCRDFAVLMIDAARALGLAARFASGYLVLSADEHGSTHAWAQVYLPGPGWVDFDPTSGSVGKERLVTVAVAHDPQHTLPLHGTYVGTASDSLGMDVKVFTQAS